MNDYQLYEKQVIQKEQNLVNSNGRKPASYFQGLQQKGFHTIAVANQKGGVAKTTTSVSLGGALTNYNQKVLLVDLDPQANLTLAMGLDPRHIRESVFEVFKGNRSIEKVIRESAIPGLYFIPSNREMGKIDPTYAGRQDRDVILRNAFDVFKESPHHSFDYIILDCPPSNDTITLNALVAANLLIIPTQPEFFSVNALRSMMSIIQDVRSRQNPHLIYRILITMLDGRNKIHSTLAEQIKLTFKQGVFHTMVSMDTKLRESTLYGLPITYFKQKTRSAIQYSAIAQELIEYVSKKTVSTI